MSKTDYPGIDYSLGMANRDKESGIHYGVISAHQLHEWIWEDIEAIYDAYCPHCEALLTDDEFLVLEENGECPRCEVEVEDSSDCWGEEPSYHKLEMNGYLGQLDEMMDIFLLESPYYTRAQFCSPCAPGAGYLANPCPTGPKTYCLGHEMFDGGKAPYPVYRVDNDEEVVADVRTDND